MKTTNRKWLSLELLTIQFMFISFMENRSQHLRLLRLRSSQSSANHWSSGDHPQLPRPTSSPRRWAKRPWRARHPRRNAVRRAQVTLSHPPRQRNKIEVYSMDVFFFFGGHKSPGGGGIVGVCACLSFLCVGAGGGSKDVWFALVCYLRCKVRPSC